MSNNMKGLVRSFRNRVDKQAGYNSHMDLETYKNYAQGMLDMGMTSFAGKIASDEEGWKRSLDAHLNENLHFAGQRFGICCDECKKPMKTLYVNRKRSVDYGSINSVQNVIMLCYRCDKDTIKSTYDEDRKEIHCKSCNRKIVGNNYGRKYCSDYCKKHDQYLKFKHEGIDKPLHIKTCEQCHEDFTAKRSDARFCSKLCKQNAHNAKNRMLKAMEKG